MVQEEQVRGDRFTQKKKYPKANTPLMEILFPKSFHPHTQISHKAKLTKLQVATSKLNPQLQSFTLPFDLTKSKKKRSKITISLTLS